MTLISKLIGFVKNVRIKSNFKNKNMNKTKKFNITEKQLQQVKNAGSVLSSIIKQANYSMENNIQEFNTGLLGRDPKDKKDYLLSEVQPVGVELPVDYLLKDKQTPVQTQNGYGICYGMATTGIAEFWNSAEYSTFINLSERFTAHFTKVLSGRWDVQGDYFRYAVKAVCDYGICKEDRWPNDFSLSWDDFIKPEPTEDIKKEAEEFKGKTYWRVNPDIESLKQAIYQNQTPVLIGMNWFSSYNITPQDGHLPLPSGNQSGHAIICVGWENNKLYFKNSWGLTYGNQGYFYIPFNEFDKHDIWDVWILLDLPKKNDMLKIIGDKGSGKQYILGQDNKLRHIFNPTILHDLSRAGVIDESQVDWQSSIDGYEIAEPWAVIKNIDL